MNRSELESRVNGGRWAGVHWAAEGDLTQATYNIVPVDGGFTIYCPSDREGFFQLYDNPSEPVFFATENDVCEYVWGALQEPRDPTSPAPAQTVERIADRKRRMNENRVDHGLEPLP
jgi:hypothetical protein